MSCRYKIIVQWVEVRKAYEAFAPSLLPDVDMFLPGKTLLVVHEDPVEALKEAMLRANTAANTLQELGIIPSEAVA